MRVNNLPVRKTTSSAMPMARIHSGAFVHMRASQRPLEKTKRGICFYHLSRRLKMTLGITGTILGFATWLLPFCNPYNSWSFSAYLSPCLFFAPVLLPILSLHVAEAIARRSGALPKI